MSCIRTVILWNTILLSLFVLTACAVRDLVGRWKSIPEDGVVERRLVFVQYTAMQDADFDQLNLRVGPNTMHGPKIKCRPRFGTGISCDY